MVEMEYRPVRQVHAQTTDLPSGQPYGPFALSTKAHDVTMDIQVALLCSKGTVRS